MNELPDNLKIVEDNMHTPTPWMAPFSSYIIGGDRKICQLKGIYVDNLNRDADAEFIVRACNSHADLLEALELHMQWIGRPPTDPHSYDSLREEAWRKGKQAIEKAKE